MRRIILVLLAAASRAIFAQLSDLPPCALSCFTEAIAETTCGLADTYCQCTKGAQKIEDVVVPCLCHSTCSAAELEAALKASNGICSSALAASSQTYTPATAAACAATASPTLSGGIVSASAAVTGTATEASASMSSAATGTWVSPSAAAATMLRLNTGGAVIGLTGLGGLAWIAL